MHGPLNVKFVNAKQMLTFISLYFYRQRGV